MRTGISWWGRQKSLPGSCAIPKDLKRPLNPTLSLREKQVVDLICKGKLNKEIAYELHLTEGTVKEYLNRIFRKVGSSNRTELAVWAITGQARASTAVNGPTPRENYFFGS